MNAKYWDEGPVLDGVKEKVHRLKEILSDRMPEIKLGECYDIYVRLQGYKNWNFMVASIKNMNANDISGSDIVKISMLIFKSEDEAFEWLNSPIAAFNNMKPVDLWGTDEGARKVVGELKRVERERKKTKTSEIISDQGNAPLGATYA